MTDKNKESWLITTQNFALNEMKKDGHDIEIKELNFKMLEDGHVEMTIKLLNGKLKTTYTISDMILSDEHRYFKMIMYNKGNWKNSVPKKVRFSMDIKGKILKNPEVKDFN